MALRTVVTQLAISVLLSAAPCAAQIDVNQFVDQNAIPFLNRSKPLKVDVKWDMDGKSQVFLNEGINYLDEGKLPLSLANIDSFLFRNPKMWAGHFYRGQALMRLGRYKEAEVEFTAVSKINPSLIENYIALSETFELRRQFDAAEKPLQDATNENPKYVYVYYKLGNLALFNRDATGAMTYYKKCNKVDPKFPDAYMAMGIIAFSRDKNLDEGISWMDKSLKADSTFMPAYYWRGLIFLQKNEKQKCLADWGKFIQRNPNNQFMKTMRAFLNTELGNYEDAFSDFQKILQNTRVDEDKFQAAQTSLDKRIDLQFAANYLIKKGYGLREEVFGALKAGFCLMVVDKNRDAMQYLKKAERMATSPAIYFLMAIAYEHGGLHNAAFQYYNKTIQLDNDVFDAHKKRGIYLGEVKRWDDANKDITEMFRLQPENPTAYRLRGLMESNQAKYSQAIADLTFFLKTDSTDAEALRTRGICYSLSGRSKEAAHDYLRLFDDQSQDYTEQTIKEVLTIKDTANVIVLLKKYFKKYETLSSLVELSKIWIAQKKYADVSAQVSDARAKVKALEKTNAGNPLRTNFGSVRSELFLIEGMVAFSQSMCADAISFFSSSLKENPANHESKYLRGKCYVKIGDPKKAIDDFNELKAEKYKDAEALCSSLAGK